MMSDAAFAIALPFIAEREGFSSKPYRDSGGKTTYGYGFTTLDNGHEVTLNTPPISQHDAYIRLGQLVSAVLVNVRAMIHVPVTDHAVAALVSFSYNLGTAALRNSTLMRLLNQGKPLPLVASQFDAWIYDDNKRSQGLINRRRMERLLFLTPDADEADILDEEYNS